MAHGMGPWQISSPHFCRNQSWGLDDWAREAHWEVLGFWDVTWRWFRVSYYELWMVQDVQELASIYTVFFGLNMAWPSQESSWRNGSFWVKKPTTDKYFMIPYILITIILVAFWAPQFFDQPTLLPTWLQTIDRPVFQTAYCTGDLCCSIAVLPSKNYPKVSNSYYRVNPSHIWLWINTY